METMVVFFTNGYDWGNAFNAVWPLNQNSTLKMTTLSIIEQSLLYLSSF